MARPPALAATLRLPLQVHARIHRKVCIVLEPQELHDIAYSWPSVAIAKRCALAEGRHSPPANNDEMLED